jgi:hypothetical protein
MLLTPSYVWRLIIVLELSLLVPTPCVTLSITLKRCGVLTPVVMLISSHMGVAADESEG